MDGATQNPRKRTGRPPKIPIVIVKPHQTNKDVASHDSDIQQTPVSTEVKNSASQSLEQEITELNASVLALSPEPEDPAHSSNSSLTGGGAGGECRRSSRKKIIKFDVRDLLNKNRKPHKIQIEARIDSNAPTLHQPKSTIDTAGVAGTSTSAACAASTDLTSKQKTFIEKSAIFRRFSISAEQQNKVVPPLRPPPPPPLPTQTAKISLLGKPTAACDSDVVLPAVDAAKIAQARRLSRTQEIFNASMMKSKQNSSLIVAQMQSNSTSSSCSNSSITSTTANQTPPVQKKAVGIGKRKAATKSIANTLSKATVNPSTSELTDTMERSVALEVSTLKRRGRPPKSKVIEKSSVTASTSKDVDKSLKTSDTVASDKEVVKEINRIKAVNTPKQYLGTDLDNDEISFIQVSESSSQQLQLTPEKAKNWKEYKACLNKSDQPDEQESSISKIDTMTTESSQSLDNKVTNPTATQSTAQSDIRKQYQLEDIILEISSSSSMSSSTGLKSQASNEFSNNRLENCEIKSTIDANKTKQRNFEVVSFLQESPDLNDVNITTAPEFIVAAVEEIIPEVQDAEHCKDTSSEVLAIVEVVSTSVESEDVKHDSIDVKYTVEKEPIEIKFDEQNLKCPLTPIRPSQEMINLNSPTRRTLSSSESETNSDRSNKPYKQGDKLRVSLKRLIMPESPTSANCSTTSSSRSSSEISTASTSSMSHVDNPVIKAHTTKRSKRLQKKKKIDEKNDTDSTTSEEAKEPKAVEGSKVRTAVKIVQIAETNTMIESKENELKSEVEKTITEKVTKQVENKNNIEGLENLFFLNQEVEAINTVKEIVENVGNPTNLKETEDQSVVTQPQEYISTILSDTDSSEKRKSSRLVKIFQNVEQSFKNKFEEKNSESIEINEPVQEAEEVSTEIVINTNQEISNIYTPTTESKLEVISDDIKDADDMPSSQISDIENITVVQNIAEETKTQESDELTKTIQNVSVETSTLLDILRTVQSNKEAATNVADISESPILCEEISACDRNKLTMSPVSSEKALTSTYKLHDSRATDSPSRSETDSPQTTRKAVTRRYERRSRRGEETSHKTLEETFAEIAAQSSKAILELAAREEEDILAALEVLPELNISKPTEIIDNAQLLKDVPDEIDKFETKTTVENSITDNVDTAKMQLVEILPEQLETKSEASDVLLIEPEEHIIMESSQLVTEETKTVTNVTIKDDEVVIDNSHFETELKKQLNLTDSKITEPLITTPTRRGRKPKIKSITTTSPTSSKELAEIPVNITDHQTESLDKSETSDISKKSNKTKDETTFVESVKISESSHEITNIPTNIADAIFKPVIDIPIHESEDCTPKQTPKKRILKNTSEHVEEIETTLITVDSLDTVRAESPSESSAAPIQVLLQNIEISENEPSSNKNKNKRVVKTSEELKDQLMSTPKRGKNKQKLQDATIDEVQADIKQFEEGEESRSSLGSNTPVSLTKRGKNKQKLTDDSTSDEINDVKYIEEGEESLSSLGSTSLPTPKRGKSKQKLEEVATEQGVTSEKKKTSKFCEESKTSGKVEKPSPKSTEKKEKLSNKKSDKKKFLEMEDAAAVVELSKRFEEKSAKKTRQKKLKEAFEAALSDNLEKNKNYCETKDCSTVEIFNERVITPERQSPIDTLLKTPTEFDTTPKLDELVRVEKSVLVITEPEDDPDPLKDIEKFIEDGVNLLKRGYKIDEDSGDEVIIKPTLTDIEDSCENPMKSTQDQLANVCNVTTTEILSIDTSFTTALEREISRTPIQNTFFETPADTPHATPTASPPPKSPVLNTGPDELSGVRRSHRIKLITKTPKALVGRGLVRDNVRFSFKNDVETKSHYSLDDHLTDLAEVEAKNAKFLKDMEERLSNFQVIKENEYMCERAISREARKMICDCFLTSDEEGRGELGCGEDCLNRLLMIECGPDCNVKDRCTNKRFQKFLCSPCRVFRTEKKGFGIMADIEILPGEFIMEYVGEAINGDEFENRRTLYSQDKNRHYYFMALRSDAIIDATIKGNISRFINHSCDPNAETQKWTVNGELRIGFFSRKSIMPGEEITFNYQYQRYGREAQRCYCESSNCRGWIGEEPTSDEGEQLDEDSDEEAEMLADSLLDDDDSDTESVTDAEEEVQKKLEIAAAEAKLTPISDEHKEKIDAGAQREKELKSSVDVEMVNEGQEQRKETEEDSKSKFKKLLNKMAEKVAKKKQKQNEKKQRKRRPLSPSLESAAAKSRYLEDPDIEDEVNFLSSCGLKNQSDTLRLSRLMVRAKLVQTRLNLLQILRKGELPCRRLFLDYHGMRLLHGWMSEDGGDMHIRMALLQTLESLPIANKTVLTDSKVYQAVRNWCGTATAGVSTLTAPSSSSLSPSDDSSKESSTSSNNSQQAASVIANTATAEEEPSDLQKLAAKLTASWDSLPEIFRIPKRERIEQMKEHEREADRQYAAAVEDDTNKSTVASGSDRYHRDRFGRGLNMNRFVKPHGGSKEIRNITVMGTGLASGDPRRRLGIDSGGGPMTVGDGSKLLSKEQRREMFAAKVARDEAEKRLAEERREFETKCRFFGLDPKKTRPPDVPFCVNPATGQWFSADRKTIPTPPSYAHVQVPIKPKSTDPADYQLPPVVATLPPQWKYSITPHGKIYYYHVQFRIPQWEPPSASQMYGSSQGHVDSDSESEGGADDSTDDDDEIIMGMNPAQLKAYIEKKIETRRQQRYNRLVDERCISPRREEDRIYNQLEVRKYKENKEKIRKRKEEIRRKRADALKHSTLNMCTLGSLDDSTASGDLQAHRPTKCTSSSSSAASTYDEETHALPIQDYLLSSDEDGAGEEDIKTECDNSPLIDKIVQGDKIVDELDALTTKRSLKRSSLPTSLIGAVVTQASTSAAAAISASILDKHEHKRRKLEKKEKSKKSKDSSDSKYRKTKEKFRCEIAGIIVHHLKPYRKDSCFMGRIQSDEDFNHLARKLTHFVMIKELKYCESVGQTLVVTESVKNKSREFIKKYMAKYGDVYVRATNDPEFKDIPFTL